MVRSLSALALVILLCYGVAGQEAGAPLTGGPRPLLPLEPGVVDAQGDALPAGATARLGSTRFRLAGMVGVAALSPDGKWIASSNNGDIITLADPTSGKELNRFRLPSGYGASFLTFSPDGRSLAVMGYSTYLQVVAVPSGKLMAKLQIAQPNNGNNYRLSGLAFSGDGKTVVASTDNFGQNKNFVYAWDVITGKMLHPFEVVQNSQVRGVLSHDGSVLATSGYFNQRTSADTNPDQGRTIQIWNVRTGKELRKIKIERNQVMAAALSPDGKTCAVASGAATFHLFETDSGTELRRFSGRRGHVQILQFAPDGATLVACTADGTIQMWQTGTGKRLGLTEGSRQRLLSIAFPSPGCIWALGLEGQALILWDAANGQLLSPQGGHMSWVRLLTYAPDGKTLLSGGADGKICWWDAAGGNEIRHQFIRDEDSNRYGGYPPGSRVTSYALSNDGKLLAAASEYATHTIRLIDMDSGKVLCDFDAPRTNSPSGFTFSPDNRRLAAIGVKGVHVWDVTTGQELATLPFKGVPGNNGAPAGGSLVFSQGGRILAGTHTYYDRNTGTPVGDVYLWDAGKGAEIACLQGSGYTSGTPAFSPNGQVLALPMSNQSVLLVKAATGRELGRLEGSQSHSIQGLAFSPDGRLVAGAQQENYTSTRFNYLLPVTSPGNRIVVWELASGQIRQEFTGHQGAVACLAFSPSSSALASGSADTTALLWDLSGKRNTSVMPLAPLPGEVAWQGLAESDGKHAYNELMTGMINSPEATIEVLRRHLHPAQGMKAGPEEIEHLISELDSERFAVRARATTALEQLGTLAAPALRNAQKGISSLEAQRRVKGLLERLEQAVLPAEEIRAVRAIEVLEKIGSPQARMFLHDLAGGAPQSRLTVEAQAALVRLNAN